MKNYIALFLLMSVLSSAYSQVEVFKTLEDYQKGISIKYDGDPEFFPGAYLRKEPSGIFIKPNKGKKEKIEFNTIWAFKYKKHFFRIGKGDYYNIGSGGSVDGMLVPVVLRDTGKFCYWENAQIFLDFLREGKDNRGNLYFRDNIIYFSNTLTSEFINGGSDCLAFLKTIENGESVITHLKEYASKTKGLHSQYAKKFSDATLLAAYISLSKPEIMDEFRKQIKKIIK